MQFEEKMDRVDAELRVPEGEVSSTNVDRPKFPAYSLLKHYRGGLYMVVGLPKDNVLEATREASYAYLMEDGRTCHRSQLDMEEAGKFEVLGMNTVGIIHNSQSVRLEKFIEYVDKLRYAATDVTLSPWFTFIASGEVAPEEKPSEEDKGPPWDTSTQPS